MTPTIAMVAGGSPFYGRMAFNLAATIKAFGGGKFKVVIACTPTAISHLDEVRLGVFDELIDLDHGEFEAMVKAGKFGRVKLNLHKLFKAYDQVLFIDVDSLVLPYKLGRETLYECYRRLEALNRPLVFQSGAYQAIHKSVSIAGWSDWPTMVNRFQLNPNNAWLELSSYTIMMRTNDDRVDRFYETANTVYAALDADRNGFRIWQNQPPDELCAELACAFDQHQHLIPADVTIIHQNLEGLRSFMDATLFGFTITGEANITTMSAYNHVVSAACYRLGLKNLLIYTNKSRFK